MMAGPSAPNQGRSAGKDLSPRLAFSEIVKNRTLSPCSLPEFMDYLVYVEHNAENLQFFLWYCDYVERWSKLSPRQKALSPEWTCGSDGTTQCSLAPLAAHKRAKSEKLTRILAILDRESAAEPLPEPSSDQTASKPASIHDGNDASINLDAKSSEYSLQPFREELTQIAGHYIAEGSTRQLRLSAQDRKTCLQAIRQTTHPSALLPAFTMVDGILREFSHPSFIAWALRINANPRRLALVRSISAVGVALGLILDIFFILSGISHYLRVLGLTLMWPGAMWLIAAARGICIELHFRGLRQLRPWEQQQYTADDDVEMKDTLATTMTATTFPLDGEEKGLPSAATRHMYHYSWYGCQGRTQHTRDQSAASRVTTTVNRSASVTISRSASVTHSARPSTDDDAGAVAFRTVITAGSARKNRMELAEAMRRPSMLPLGPGNSHAGSEGLVGGAAFGPATPVRSADVRLMQDREVLRAVVGGGVAAAALTIGFLFVPSGDFYLNQ